MEAGTPVWVWQEDGVDDDFPDDIEACGVWRRACISSREELAATGKGGPQIVFEATYDSGDGCGYAAEPPAQWRRAYAATDALGSTDLPGLKLRNLVPGALGVAAAAGRGGSDADEAVALDLVTLPHLHEAAILHSLRARHALDEVRGLSLAPGSSAGLRFGVDRPAASFLLSGW